jgi:hypothetical protein
MTHLVAHSGGHLAVHMFCGKLVDNGGRTALLPV